jgi:hypothetical protein
MSEEITLQEIAENIENKICLPLSDYFENNDFDNLRELLDFAHPYNIHNKIVEGANDFFSEFGEYSSDDTDNLIKKRVSELEEFADKLFEIWQPLDNYECNEVWYSYDELIDADETWSGATIGALFGGVGAIIGAWIGASAAEERIQNEVQEFLQYYLQGLSKYIEAYQETIQNEIVPSFLEDIAIRIEQEEIEEKQKSLTSPQTGNSFQAEQLQLLERLGELRNKGVITEQEFQNKKSQILTKL